MIGASVNKVKNKKHIFQSLTHSSLPIPSHPTQASAVQPNPTNSTQQASKVDQTIPTSPFYSQSPKPKQQFRTTRQKLLKKKHAKSTASKDPAQQRGKRNRRIRKTDSKYKRPASIHEQHVQLCFAIPQHGKAVVVCWVFTSQLGFCMPKK